MTIKKFKKSIQSLYDVDAVANLLDELKEKDLEEGINYVRSLYQNFARQLNQSVGTSARYGGLLAMATGVGKSKIAIDQIIEECRINTKARILIVVPTEKLRDENWKEEFSKWDCMWQWENNIERSCYASIDNIENELFDFVVFDEGHNLTPNNSKFFSKNEILGMMVLSATPPSDPVKVAMLKDLGIELAYTLSLDSAVKLKLVAPYDITVVELRLDDIDKYIEAGSKDKRFFQTEKKAYDYINQQVNKLMYAKSDSLKYKLIQRMRFIYNLRSKTKAARALLSMIPIGSRVITFCGSIEQADELADKESFLANHKDGTSFELAKTFHSKSGDIYLTKFKDGVINRITCVNALNEGHNIKDLDYGIVVQLNSNERNLIQRIGRIVRYRPGHTAKIIIIMVLDTVDEKWVKSALSGLDSSKISYVRFSNIEQGVTKLFN